MPTYKVKPETDYPMNTVGSTPDKKKKRYPTVTLPVSQEILNALELEGDVEVTLKGKVVGLESRESTGNDPYNNRKELRVELRTVEAYPDDDAGDDEEEEKEPDMKDAIDEGLGYSKK